MFFDILLYSASINGHCTLGQSSCESNERFGVSINKQSLDERFHDGAVSFMRSLFEEQLDKQVGENLHPAFLEKFSRVRIKDATRFDLPEHLKEHFKGFGGKLTSGAGIGIQYEYDLKNGKVLDLDITDAIRPDITDAQEKTENIEAGDLVLRDLGYFSIKVLKAIIKNGAFIVSRLQTKISVYGPDCEQISFSKLYSWMLKHKISHLQKQVLIGKDDKIPIRLIIDIVPEEIYQKRLKKIEQYNHKNGNQTTDDYKARCRFNLMVTNVPEEDLPEENVYLLYKLRWQIELIFKIWKSTCGIDKLQPMKYHRFICTLYAKLLLVLIHNQIFSIAQKYLYERYRKLLSRNKCFKTLTGHFAKTREWLSNEKDKTKDFLHDIANMFSKNHWLEKRKKHISFEEIFELFV
jgi:hypothetical protein